MARFQLDIEKRLGSEFWTNVYQLEASDLANAQVISLPVVEAERSFHAQIVNFTRYRVSSVAMNDGVYTIVPIGLTGERAASSVLPLFNTLRMDFTAQSGRPSRKYYRGVLDEFDINGDAVTTATFNDGAAALFGTFYDGEGGGGVVDPQGQLLTAITIWPFVQMRQLRRSRRKRTNGGGIFQ
jgi:hypothetical protein